MQARSMQSSLAQETALLKGLLGKVEKTAPKDEWEERLAKDDIPVDLTGVDIALDKATNNIFIATTLCLTIYKNMIGTVIFTHF